MPKGEKDPNEIGALWAKESNSGKRYMTGSVTIAGVETRIVCFPVSSQHPKAPHWRILKSVPRERDGFQGQGDEDEER